MSDVGLVWGIKRSFLTYVRQMPDGKGYVADGATALSPDALLFAPLPATTERALGSGERIWAFQGDVRFSGHAGMLFVRIAQPWIAAKGALAALSIIDPSRIDPSTAPDDPAVTGRLTLVTLSLEQVSAEGGTESWRGTEVRLTPQGADLFNNVYAPGEPFDDLSFTVPL